MRFFLTWRMEGRLSGFTLTISWLSSRSSSAGQCSSVQPRSLYEKFSFELQKDQASIEIFVSAAFLFHRNSESHLVFAEALRIFLRSLVRMAAIAHNRRQISRFGANNEWTTNRHSPKRGKRTGSKQNRGGNMEPERTTKDGISSFLSDTLMTLVIVRSWKRPQIIRVLSGVFTG